MATDHVSLRTHDGECPAHVFTPPGDGPWPAVIFCMDGFGIRPTLFQMARRLADHGYVVLLPDLFYRAGPYGPLNSAEIIARGNILEQLAPLLASTDNRRAAQDAQAFIAYLDSRDNVAGPKIGVTGYCMGGGISLSIAGTYPERIGAAASFHGGNLATDADTSPHLLAPMIKAQLYVAGADHDDSYPPEMAERLKKALTDAGVTHRCETYEGALHGWTMSDFPIFDEAASERHWRELTALLEKTLK